MEQDKDGKEVLTMGTDQRDQPLLEPSNKIDMVDDEDELTK